MKKVLTALVCSIVLVSTASADFLRAEVGAGAWLQTAKGDMPTSVSDEEQKTQPYVWAFVKHPVPVVPNLRLEYVGVESTDGATSLKLTQYDVIPYYNILDNTGWITLDLGLDVKIIEAKQNLISSDSTDTLTLPLGYVRARFQLPLTGLGAEADIKYITYQNNTLYDARAKLDYTLEFIPLIQPAIEIGYRVQKYKTDKLFDKNMDLDFSGIYAGLMVRF